MPQMVIFHTTPETQNILRSGSMSFLLRAVESG
jgi:hypothetical protein